MKDTSRSVLVVLVVIAVIFSVVTTAVLWSATQTEQTIEPLGIAKPSTTTGRVSVTVVPKETAPEGGDTGGG